MQKALTGIVLLFTLCQVHAQTWLYTPPNSAYFNYSGNKVGIGTSNPQATLDVAGNLLLLTGDHQTYFNEGAAYDPTKGGIRNNAGNIVLQSKDNGILFLNRDVNSDTRIESYASGVLTEIAAFKANGNVGIGTITPQAKLDVQGSYYLGRPAALVDAFNTLGIPASSYLAIAPSDMSASNDSYMVLSFPDNNSFRVGTNYDGHVGSPKYRDIQFGRYFGNPYMTIKDGGSVCIGTTDPKGYLLAVNGPAIFTQAVVKLNANWPDYVFKRDYHLPSLDSVSQFIQDHHHLPDMPSADSVAKNGVDLGSNQAQLLKKIEELTLYVIQQRQQQGELKQQLDELRQRNKEMKEQMGVLKKVTKNKR